MARLLAIDYGSKRSGIAVTDPLQIIATALDTVPTHDLRTFLKKYTSQEQVEAFIVGMPKKMDNTDSENAARVQAFIKLIQKDFPEIPVHTHDERFTSSMALQSMISAGSKKSDRREKGNIDKVSATIILQSFMESRGNARNFSSQ
ncbi:Holliday junction resolvase RuvX [Dyadobacter sp. Leaf189]|uniref:Holliday junction resolvase RuvX n=1 Tax=Dyadobacter sp. Leaf189 TaxID=1736295 RepID=UPI000700EA41|nr:Holliday junction resolvase RuvX [Dyadobacter sp. Leaf189]KQS32773.1 Holliday junction resolvase [Dyadobacter sp. Leaf189]